MQTRKCNHSPFTVWSHPCSPSMPFLSSHRHDTPPLIHLELCPAQRPVPHSPRLCSSMAAWTCDLSYLSGPRGVFTRPAPKTRTHHQYLLIVQAPTLSPPPYVPLPHSEAAACSPCDLHCPRLAGRLRPCGPKLLARVRQPRALVDAQLVLVALVVAAKHAVCCVCVGGRGGGGKEGAGEAGR